MPSTEFGIESVRVMDAANTLLQIQGCSQRLVACTGAFERAYQYRTARGKTAVVPVYRRNSVLTGVRSVLQRVNEKAGCNWLINGQASVNMKELLFAPEGGAVIQYNRQDVHAMQYELAVGINHPDPTTLADKRTADIEAYSGNSGFPAETVLITRDEHDIPSYISLGNGAEKQAESA